VLYTKIGDEVRPLASLNQSPPQISTWHQASAATPVVVDNFAAADHQQNDQVQQQQSKTGTEIWGTPDPIPFARTDSQDTSAEQNISSKCVVRVSNGLVWLFWMPKFEWLRFAAH